MSSAGQAVQGLLIGTVTEIDASLGRVKVAIPEREHDTHWAPVAAAMAGGGRGAFFMPEVGDEVIIGFDRGQFDHPYVVGFLWNGQDAPPRTDGKIRVLRSVNGHELTFYDPPVSGGDKGYIRVTDAHGNQVELANGRITVTGVGLIQIQAPVVTINGRIVAPVGPPI
jgi:uncharacterized protein involved in type VI secretion and phage assembly